MAVGCPAPAPPGGSDVGLVHALKAAMERNPRAGAEKRDGRSVKRETGVYIYIYKVCTIR